MRKFILSLVTCLIGFSAMAQIESKDGLDDIDAVHFVQGQTSDWYLLASYPEVTFVNSNPVIKGKTYDLADGDVVTTFGKMPVGPVTAIDETYNTPTIHKVLYNGQVVIREEGKTYNVEGVQIQ